MLDRLVLTEPCPVISNVHDSGSREPVGQHGLISKPIDLAIEPWLAGWQQHPETATMLDVQSAHTSCIWVQYAHVMLCTYSTRSARFSTLLAK